MKHLMLLFASLLPAVAAITGVSVQGTTATQAILRFTAPDTGACTVEVSESPGFAPLVHDVDALLFPGSNLDNRADNTYSGRERGFVIGKRRAEKTLNGKWYSRALQAFTPHYYRITCGADQATGSFSTTNIVLGNTYNDPLPGDPGAAGSATFVSDGRYAYPEFTKWDHADPTARQETVIDPQTGALLKRITMPGDQGTANSPAGDHFIVNGAPYGTNWSNPNNAAVDDGAAATYSAAGTDWLVLPSALPLDGNAVLESLTVSLKAWCAGTCTDPIQVGLSVNGVNAWPADSNTIEHVLGTSALPSSFTVFGVGSYIMGDWTPVGYQPLTPTDIRARSGVVDVDGSGNVTWDSGDWFYPNWIAGSRITIDSLVCTIAGLTDPKHLVIDPASCALALPVTGKAYSASNFALTIRKKVANADTIGVQYAKYNITQPAAPGWSSSGSPEFCSQSLTLNVATGAHGYHCVFPSLLPEVYWISSTDASANYLGFYTTGYVGGADGWDNNGCANASVTFQATAKPNQESFSCIVSDHSGKPVVLFCTLDSTNAAGNLSIACSNLTKSSTARDLPSLAVNFTAGQATVFDPAAFKGCGISGIQNGQLMLSCIRSQQDTIGWVLVFDPAKVSGSPGCVGGGLPGCIIAAQNTWATAPARFCVLHTLFSAGDGATNIAWVAGKFFSLGSPPGGGFQLSTLTSAALTATPAVAAGTGGCPGGSLGCDNVTVDGEPCNPFPAAGEGGNGSCAKDNAQQGLQNAAAGDALQVQPGPVEWVRIVAKTDAAHWLIQRAIGPPNSNGPVPLNHSGFGTLNLSEMCLARAFNPGFDVSNDSWTWDFEHDPYATNSGGATVVLPAADYDHPVPRQAGVVGVTSGYTASAGILAAPGVLATYSPKFAGISSLTIALEAAQDHVSHTQDQAPPEDQTWLLDARTLNGPGSTVIDRAVRVSGQLYKYTAAVVDKDNFKNIGGGWGNLSLTRKLQPTMAVSGTQPLVDISSAATGNVIGDTSADSYKYCVVRFTNECRAGSAVGEFFVNAPFVNTRSDGTYGSSQAIGEGPLINDLLIFNSDAYLNAVSQVGYRSNDPVGALGRTLTKALLRYKILDYNMNVKSLPNASWLLFWNAAMPGAGHAVMAAKMPPYPAVDSVNRAVFVPMVLSLSPPDGITVDNAVVRFGYAENGAADQFYCTSRHEACLAVAATVPTDPFKFPSDGADGTAATITGVNCASGCSVAIPAIPQRSVYYQVQYRDSGNRVIAQTPLQVASAP
jgi:hypothetical protein